MIIHLGFALEKNHVIYLIFNDICGKLSIEIIKKIDFYYYYYLMLFKHGSLSDSLLFKGPC